MNNMLLIQILEVESMLIIQIIGAGHSVPRIAIFGKKSINPFFVMHLPQNLFYIMPSVLID